MTKGGTTCKGLSEAESSGAPARLAGSFVRRAKRFNRIFPGRMSSKGGFRTGSRADGWRMSRMVLQPGTWLRSFLGRKMDGFNGPHRIRIPGWCLSPGYCKVQEQAIVRVDLQRRVPINYPLGFFSKCSSMKTIDRGRDRHCRPDRSGYYLHSDIGAPVLCVVAVKVGESVHQWVVFKE